MPNKKPGSVKIDGDIHSPFAKFCREKGFNISQKATLLLREFLVKEGFIKS